MKRTDLQQLQEELTQVRISIEKYKNLENHVEKNRYLKMIDAELMDALHNMEQLIEMTSDDPGGTRKESGT